MHDVVGAEEAVVVDRPLGNRVRVEGVSVGVEAAAADEQDHIHGHACVHRHILVRLALRLEETIACSLHHIPLGERAYHLVRVHAHRHDRSKRDVHLIHLAFRGNPVGNVHCGESVGSAGHAQNGLGYTDVEAHQQRMEHVGLRH